MGTVYTLPLLQSLPSGIKQYSALTTSEKAIVDGILANALRVCTRTRTYTEHSGIVYNSTVYVYSDVSGVKLTVSSDYTIAGDILYFPCFFTGNIYFFSDSISDNLLETSKVSTSVLSENSISSHSPGVGQWYIDLYPNRDAARDALINVYPITYHYTNSTVSGPTEAAVGDTVIVSAVPDVGYGIADASTQILVTNDDVAVPYTWDAVNQRITFTMPQPAANRGGFGSTGQ